jgi:3-hydroxyacyl-[acyl-carrier-protein] dehydratase
MRFNLVDAIEEVQPAKLLRAVKHLTLGEEYLADHFPTFPVMPGVLMLQALVETGAWLVRRTGDFAHSVTVLREVRNIKYGSFMEPGKTLSLQVEIAESKDTLTTLKGKGETDGTSTVSARLVLESYRLGDKDPEMTKVDERIIDHLKQKFAWLCRAGAKRTI